MKKSSSLLATLIFCLFFKIGQAQNCTGNLLQNPGFENSLNNWDGSGGEIVATGTHGGTKALKLCQTGNIARQTLPATAGKTYKLDGFLKRDGSAQPFLFMKFLSASWTPLTNPYANWLPTSDWSTFDPFSATAPAGTAWVEISFFHNSGTGCVYADDLCLTDGNCSLQVAVSPVTCSDNGTPNDSSDDKMEFSFTPTGVGPQGWIANFPPILSNTVLGANGETKHMSFSIFDALGVASNGKVPVKINAHSVANCEFNFEVAPPPTCSNGGGFSCPGNLLTNPDFDQGVSGWTTDIAAPTATNSTLCSGSNFMKLFGKFTNSNPTNANSKISQTKAATAGKTYNLKVRANIFTSTAMVARVGFIFKNGNVGLDSSFGVYGAASENWQTFTAVNAGGCTYTDINLSKIAPPGTTSIEVVAQHLGGFFIGQHSYSEFHLDAFCLTETAAPNCALNIIPGAVINCDNNGTPNLATDDTYSFTITVSNTGDCGAGWTGGATPFFSGSFGVAYGFGQFPISGGNKTLTFAAAGAPSITKSITMTAPPTCSAGTGGVDLELSASSTNFNPAQWAFFSGNFVIKNNGTAPASGVKVKFNLPAGMVYKGGQEFTASQGSFNFWATNEWSVGNLAPGATADLTLNYFNTTTAPKTLFGQVSAQNEPDLDSQPNNNTTTTPAQDDEAALLFNPPSGGPDVFFTNCPANITVTAAPGATGAVVNYTYPTINYVNCGTIGTANFPAGPNNLYNPALASGNSFPIGVHTVALQATCGNIVKVCTFNVSVVAAGTNLPDLNLANLTFPSLTVAAGQVLNYKFDLKNTGNAAASGNFNVKAWISKDASIDAGDVQDGIVPTGNLAAGQTVSQVSGATTIPANLLPGTYGLILKVDADGQITESDENNNILPSPIYINVVPGNGGNCALSHVLGPVLCNDKGTPNNATDDTYNFTLTISNTGACGTGWTGGIAPFTSGSFGIAYGFGDYLISGGNKVLTIRDNANPSITTVVTVVAPPTCSNNVSPKPDLNLTLTASPQNPGQWKNTMLTLTLKNTGAIAANNVTVDFINQSNSQIFNQLAYQSHTAPAGTTFNSWTGLWTVGTVNPGQTLVLTYNAFTKVAAQIPIFSQVKTASPADLDSAPGNNSSGVPAEDDEARVVVNSNMLAAGDDRKLDFENVPDFQNMDDLQLFPNPAGESVFLKLPEKSAGVSIGIFNQVGVSEKEYSFQKIENEAVELDLSDVKNGVYFLRIEIPGERFLIKRLIVSRLY